MDPQKSRWTRVVARPLGVTLIMALTAWSPLGAVGLRRVDPAEVLPLDQVVAGSRAEVAEVIREHNFHHQSKPDTFPCNPKVYLSLLNDPAITLALWQDLSPTTARLHQISPGVYQGNDGAGATATWQFVLRSPRLNVLLCQLDYTSPRGNARLQGRIVLIVRSGFFREVNGETWVQHDVEAFVKIDSRGWRAVAAPVKPIIEKLLQDQLQEAGWFVSLMSRLVEMYPNWASSVVVNSETLPKETREGFRDLVAQTRRPGASAGRPELAAETNATAKR